MNLTRILIPVDFSGASLRALEVGQSLAARFGAELHLFHSQPINFIVSSPYAPVLPVYYFEDLSRAAANQLHEWRLKHCEGDLVISEHLSEAAAAGAIVEIAKTLPADLIVMGTRGLSGMKHVLLGSVAERVVQQAACPVLTVKDREA